MYMLYIYGMNSYTFREYMIYYVRTKLQDVLYIYYGIYIYVLSSPGLVLYSIYILYIQDPIYIKRIAGSYGNIGSRSKLEVAAVPSRDYIYTIPRVYWIQGGPWIRHRRGTSGLLKRKSENIRLYNEVKRWEQTAKQNVIALPRQQPWGNGNVQWEVSTLPEALVRSLWEAFRDLKLLISIHLYIYTYMVVYTKFWDSRPCVWRKSPWTMILGSAQGYIWYINRHTTEEVWYRIYTYGNI